MTEQELFTLIGNRSTILGSALSVDENRTYEVLTSAAEVWNLGESFLPMSMMLGTPRAEDSEKELGAMIAQVCGKLEGMVTDAWIAGLSRNEAAVLTAVLPRFGQGGAAACGNIRLDAREIARRWNDTHAGQERIYPEPAFEN